MTPTTPVRRHQARKQTGSSSSSSTTTGTFTAEATKEATGEGVPLIDLIGGDALCDALKEYGLGIRTEKVESETVTVDGSFFSGI